MRCINSHSPFLPLQPQLKHKQQLKTPQLLWLSINEPTKLHQSPHIIIPSLSPPPRPLRTNAAAVAAAATTSSLVLGVVDSPAAKSGDVTVFLQTSAVLLFAYWLTNFVVPDIISKSLGLEKRSNDDEKPNIDSPSEDKKACTPLKKRAFNSTKPR